MAFSPRPLAAYQAIITDRSIRNKYANQIIIMLVNGNDNKQRNALIKEQQQLL